MIARRAAAEEPPQWIQSLIPVVGMLLGGSARNNVYETPQPAPSHPMAVAGSSHQSALVLDPPSSGTKRAASAAAPTIEDWLLSIDGDFQGRGRHHVHFGQYLAKFEENGIYDLTDMEDFDGKAVAELLDCAIGVANRLVKYAKEDTEKLAKTVKRARH